MVASTTGNSITIYYTDMALKFGQTAENMLASGVTIKNTEQAYSHGQMIGNMKENIVMTSNMEKASFTGLAARFTTEDGLMASRKVKP